MNPFTSLYGHPLGVFSFESIRLFDYLPNTLAFLDAAGCAESQSFLIGLMFERKAYAILDGGGVKGAALAGCLKAAEDRELKFVGYGGTSAGAIVALLAAVGYNGDELERITVDEIEFTSFLDDGGDALEELKALGTSVSDAWREVNGTASRLRAATLTARSTFNIATSSAES